MKEESKQRNLMSLLIILPPFMFLLFLGLPSSSDSFSTTTTSILPSLTTTTSANNNKIRLNLLPSHSTLSSLLPSLSAPQPLVIDSALSPHKPSYSTTHPTLYRERHGWCPYSERTWLTFELFNLPHDTIRIDNTGPGAKPSYFSGTTPQIRWEDGSTRGESMDLVARLNEEHDLGLYDSSSSSSSDVNDAIAAFRNIFPRGSRPSSRAAFLFSWNGEPLFRSDFEKTLRKTNDLLGATTTNTGPFFCGASLSAADVAWVPFLERYAAQLPCLHEGLNPRDGERYPYLKRWYDAMDGVPAYACRVKGDGSSWRKVLKMAGYGNAGVPPGVLDRMEGLDEEEADVGLSDRERELWTVYAEDRDYVAETSEKEAGATVLRNWEAVKGDVRARMGTSLWKDLPEDEERLDLAMRGLVCVLLGEEIEKASGVKEVGALASFLDYRMCVPRDMGAMSAAAIKRVARDFAS